MLQEKVSEVLCQAMITLEIVQIMILLDILSITIMFPLLILQGLKARVLQFGITTMHAGVVKMQQEVAADIHLMQRVGEVLIMEPVVTEVQKPVTALRHIPLEGKVE